MIPDDAASKCAEFNGFLASAPSLDIQEYLFKMVGYKSFFLGANNKSSEYVWEDGTPWNWTNWDSGETDRNTTGKECFQFS